MTHLKVKHSDSGRLHEENAKTERETIDAVVVNRLHDLLVLVCVFEIDQRKRRDCVLQLTAGDERRICIVIGKRDDEHEPSLTVRYNRVWNNVVEARNARGVQ